MKKILKKILEALKKYQAEILSNIRTARPESVVDASVAKSDLLLIYMCTRDAAECVRFCSTHRSTQSPCDTANGFLDRHLFQELLGPGERSDLFFTSSSVSRDFYGPHRVYFYYINTGQEIARMELPEWAALDEGLLQLTHTLVLDQCRRGLGYPAAIAEAHEQAVVTGGDRESFKQLVEDALSRNRLPVYTSEKALSKRMRWL